MAVASHATVSTKKNSRKRGLKELNLGCDDYPAFKKHRINIKSTNTSSTENKENKEIESNKFAITNVTSFSDKSNINKPNITKQDIPIHNKERKEESSDVVDAMDMDNIKKAIDNTNNNNNRKINNTSDDEEEDIDIDMVSTNKLDTNGNRNNNRVFEEDKDKMDCDIVSVLGDKAKNIYDYTPKYHRSGLLFLVQCGIGMEVTR